MNEKKTNTSSDRSILVMDAAAIRRALRRIAHEIVERNPDLNQIVLAGIPSRGNEIARRIATTISAIEKVAVPVGTIDVAMHRDDVGTRTELPVVRASTLPLPLEKRTVVIVDDVLFTGRTVRAAMDAITSFGRPAKIQLAVLIDRGHRELPIRADYVGRNLPTAPDEKLTAAAGRRGVGRRRLAGEGGTPMTLARQFPGSARVSGAGFGVSPKQSSRFSCQRDRPKACSTRKPPPLFPGSAGCQPAAFGSLPNPLHPFSLFTRIKVGGRLPPTTGWQPVLPNIRDDHALEPQRFARAA